MERLVHSMTKLGRQGKSCKNRAGCSSLKGNGSRLGIFSSSCDKAEMQTRNACLDPRGALGAELQNSSEFLTLGLI